MKEVGRRKILKSEFGIPKWERIKIEGEKLGR